MGQTLGALKIQQLASGGVVPSLHGLLHWPQEWIQSAAVAAHQQRLNRGWNSDTLMELLDLEAELAATVAVAFAPVRQRESSNPEADPLALVSALIVVSDLHLTSKMAYLFWLHDRRGQGDLSVPELVILLRSTLRGLQTLFVNALGYSAPDSTELEEIASSAFQAATSSSHNPTKVELIALLCACHRHREVSISLEPWEGRDQRVVESVLRSVLSCNDGDTCQYSKCRPADRVCAAIRAFWALSRTVHGCTSVSRSQILAHPAMAKQEHVATLLQGAPLNLGLAQYLCILFPENSCSDIAEWWHVAQNGQAALDTAEVAVAPVSEEMGYMDFVQSSKPRPPSLPRKLSPLESSAKSSRQSSLSRSRPSSARSQRRPSTPRSSQISELIARPASRPEHSGAMPPQCKAAPTTGRCSAPLPPATPREGRPRPGRPNATSRPTSARRSGNAPVPQICEADIAAGTCAAAALRMSASGELSKPPTPRRRIC